MSETFREKANGWLGLFLQVVIALSAIVLMVLLAIFSWHFANLRAQTAIDPAEAQTVLNYDATIILERATDAIDEVGLVLSFFEGAAVVITLGFATLTWYGIRNNRETRNEFDEKQKELDTTLETIQEYEPKLNKLGDINQNLENSEQSLQQTIGDVVHVLQADQEFRLQNHNIAHDLVCQVLSHDENNWLALYIAGWLEVHHVNQLKTGVEKLRRATELEPNWPTAQAAYGVALRRQASKVPKEPEEKAHQRKNLFSAAEGMLLLALSKNSRLRDFEGESFWGSVGGIRLEKGDYDSALQAYNEALKVTPSSSYPQGNVANLHLRKAKIARSNSEKTELGAIDNKALDNFADTIKYAKREQYHQPDNYWLWMDLAQSRTILCKRNPEQFEEAEKAFNSALASNPSGGAMETSLRGWNQLIEFCPKDEDWSEILKHLNEFKKLLLEAEVATNTEQQTDVTDSPAIMNLSEDIKQIYKHLGEAIAAIGDDED